jgi:hypothetical protein
VAVAGGMTWRRFRVLVAGLTGDSIWRAWLVAKANGPLEGEAAERYFSTI